MSLILRHLCSDFGLKMDKYGFVSINSFIEALKTKYPKIERGDIEFVVENCPKNRFEIKEGKIRARYGHSLKIEIEDKPFEPPIYLYHGTKPAFINKIFIDGLLSMRRQYVHLSKTVDEAVKVGKRKAQNPTIFRVKAREAFQKGVDFYDMGEIVLTKSVQPEFLEICPLE